MTLHEKVIKGLESCAEAKCETCPYENMCFGEEICMVSPLAHDAFILLKAQEPAVDAVQVVHGRWMYEHKDPGMLPCSVCGYKVMRYNNTPYCPNCGAKMDGERREEHEVD